MVPHDLLSGIVTLSIARRANARLAFTASPLLYGGRATVSSNG
jgi:hypothetical protein